MDILLEQLVYGSFPFWDRGYDVLAKSPGCRPEWVAEVLAACRKMGEAPSGVEPQPALFALPLPSGPWAIVGVDPLGADDQGRPGALAFHALLVDPNDYRKAGANPFLFAEGLRRNWSASPTLTAEFLTIKPAHSSTTDPLADRVATLLASRRRVAIDSPTPIDSLARAVWARLPLHVRRRTSVATWAFGNANLFDLLALPRLAGVELDRSYVVPGLTDQADPPPAGASRWNALQRVPSRTRWGVVGAVASVLFFGGLLAFWRNGSARLNPPGATVSRAQGVSISSARREAIEARLARLAGRLELSGETPLRQTGPLLAALVDQFHYRGPLLDEAELNRLASDPDPDRDHARLWHERIVGTFLEAEPLPSGWADLSVEAQFAAVARSFHLDPALPPESILERLEVVLSRDSAVRPTPLALKYPALSGYARFLGRLPRLER